MNKERVQEVFDKISSQSYLTAGQIPPLSLYIDQILTLFSTGTAEEKALTKSMVNNYSKEKMLCPIKGKKYSREQVLQILLICRLKSVLSMDQIRRVTKALMSDEDNEKTLETILNHADQQRTVTAQAAAFTAEHLTSENSAELLLELTQLSDFFAQAAKLLAEQDFPKE